MYKTHHNDSNIYLAEAESTVFSFLLISFTLLKSHSFYSKARSRFKNPRIKKRQKRGMKMMDQGIELATEQNRFRI